MRKIVFSIVAVSLTLVVFAAVARAQTVVRPGADYDGYANNGCVIKVEGSELHVNCRDSGRARIRYRYLAEYGIKHGPAEFKAVVDRRGGVCGPDDIRWMDPTPRTGRVVIEDCYVHIVEVEWSRNN